MRKLLLLCLFFLPFIVRAQWQTEYNQKGDEAMERKDHRNAKLWYEEGVSYCDQYSINQLTTIWMADESMRLSMRTVMNKCLNCLSELATAKDSLAIKKLIKYYTEGIGTVKNEASVSYWKGQLEQLRDPYMDGIRVQKDSKERMTFFMGYHSSPIAPFGIQIGGIGKSLGWYVRFRSNFSFQEAKNDCEVVEPNAQNKLKEPQLKIEKLDDDFFLYRSTGNEKTTSLMGSVGMMFKTTSSLYFSMGVGYWDRKLLREYVKVDDGGLNKPATTDWAKDKKDSQNGVLIDLDATYIISGKFYGTVGGNVLNFKYVYPNVGVGILF